MISVLDLPAVAYMMLPIRHACGVALKNVYPRSRQAKATQQTAKDEPLCGQGDPYISEGIACQHNTLNHLG